MAWSSIEKQLEYIRAMERIAIAKQKGRPYQHIENEARKLRDEHWKDDKKEDCK